MSVAEWHKGLLLLSSGKYPWQSKSCNLVWIKVQEQLEKYDLIDRNRFVCTLTWELKLLSTHLWQSCLTHGYAVAFQCVVGGCNASFASQGGLARHVPSHFSQQSSSKLSNQAKLKEESPSKAGLNKRKKLKNKRRCSLRTYPADSLDRLSPTTPACFYFRCPYWCNRCICLFPALHRFFVENSKAGPHAHKHFLMTNCLTNKQRLAVDWLIHKEMK